jgi:hypothetical protein
MSPSELFWRLSCEIDEVLSSYAYAFSNFTRERLESRSGALYLRYQSGDRDAAAEGLMGLLHVCWLCVSYYDRTREMLAVFSQSDFDI